MDFRGSEGGSLADAKGKGMPKGYNFYLHFDGKKVTVKKDGEEKNIYGDGIYRDGQDWHVPGYQNFSGKEKWKKAEITMMAAEEPLMYPGTRYFKWNWNQVAFGH